MTFVKGSRMASSSRSERTRQLHLAQLLQGPAQRVLAYTAAYACSQTGDITSLIKSKDLSLHFTEEELHFLSKTRTLKLFPIPVLYKIFKFCCEDRLFDQYSLEWDVSSSTTSTSTSTSTPGPASLEASIAAVHHQYDLFTSSGGGVVESLVSSILGTVRGVGEKLAVTKWKQQEDALKQSIDEILEEVLPGVDVRDRVANAARVECEQRCRSIEEAVSAMRVQRRKSSMLEDRDADLVADLALDIRLVSEKKNRHGALLYEESETSTGPEDLLEVLEQRCSEKIDGKKICCISGDHGTGKSTLASRFPIAWLKQDDQIKSISQYDHVLIVSGKELEATSITKWLAATKSERNDLNNFIEDYWCVAEAFLPRCSAKYGVKNAGLWLTTTQKILFIVDDVDELSECKVKELILFFGQIPFDSAVLILGNPEAIAKIKFSFISYSTVQHFHLHGVAKDYLLDLSSKFKEFIKSGKKKVQKSFKDAFKADMNRVGGLLEFPEMFQDTLSLWRTKTTVVKELFSASELLWYILLNKANAALEVNLDKDIKRRKKWFKWLLTVGENALHCLKTNIKCNDASLEEIKESCQKIFSTEESEKLMAVYFKKRLIFGTDSFQSIPSLTCKAQVEYFASFYIVNKLKTGEPVQNFLSNTRQEELIALVAGHLKRWYSLGDASENSEELDVEKCQEIIQGLVNYEPGKREDVQFLFKLATEFRCSHKLVQLMVNVTEYPEEWDLKLASIQQRTLEVMLQHVAPVRIILRADDQNENYELVSVLKFLCQVPISVWFESKQQFEYGSDKKMDRMLRHFLGEKVTSRVDLFSGSLSRIMLLDFPDYKSMRYIVMLALRVTDEERLSTSLRLPLHLPHILWFELKIDMCIDDVVLTALPEMAVEMLDVYLKDLDDLCVPKITGLLTKLHKRYSGIHLEHTTLSPESIYTLLKELKQRGIALCATAESVDKYRRWYYPLLSNMPNDRLLKDKEVKSILGFEDRKFYSDHKIQSSTFVRSIDAWNLTSYLEELKEIKYFEYAADNLSFIKNLKGEVVTKLSSEKKVNTAST